MADKSRIEWTDATWGPIRARVLAPDGITILKTGYHCEAVSPGCANCYAATMNMRMLPYMGTGLDYKPGYLGTPLPDDICAKLGYPPGSLLELYLDLAALEQPLRWRRGRRVFLTSMTDVFARFVPDEWLDQIFAVMALAPQHTFQVLTKRADRMRAYLQVRDGMGNAAICKAINDIPAGMGNRHGALSMPLPNVWLGVSVEDQTRADERIPLLLDTPAAVRWISAEPLLGPVDLTRLTEDKWSAFDDGWDEGVVGSPTLDWVVCGGESGAKARPMHPDWARSLRDQCAGAGVPFFFKQWGEWTDEDNVPDAASRYAEDLKAGRTYRSLGQSMRRVGKHAAGRTLDGRTHDEYPR